MTVTEVKALLNETTTTYDDFYETLIPELEQYAREYTNDEKLMFNSASVKLFVAKGCQWLGRNIISGVQAESLGDYSITYASAQTAIATGAFPADVLAYLNRYRRPQWG